MNVDVDVDWFKRHVTVEWNVLHNGEPYLQPWTDDRDLASAYADDANGPLICRTRIHYDDLVSRWIEQPPDAPHEATRADLSASGAESGHGDRREGEGLA